MRRQLAIFSALWFVIFCWVFGALTLWAHRHGVRYKGMGSALPLPTRIIVAHVEQPWAVWSIVVVVACLNVVLLAAAYRMRDQRAARIFHGWALGIQLIALILGICLTMIVYSLPLLRLAPILR